MDKMLLSGNEAIALGAHEAGATVGVGYPGTPSTEILENFKLHPGSRCEWSINEKVALEVGLGASLAGARTLVTMKHVGINVAADPLFTASYTGVKGGLVIITADDPGMHSSQNEQDNRNYAKAAKIPMLEPADSQEAKDFTKLAFELSERYDTPVFLRTTTRLSHSMGLVAPGQTATPPPVGFDKDKKKYVMLPGHARARHELVERRMAALSKDADHMAVNAIEKGDPKLGFIVSGVAYQYVKEAFPKASFLKLGMAYPFPDGKIREFRSMVEEAYVIEELDPFIEEHVKAMGLKVHGKDVIPLTGELSPELIHAAVSGEPWACPPAPAFPVPPRPPALCPGCPHRTVFGILKDLGALVTGDIGCYTLGVLPPFSAIDTCVDMGASVSMAQGVELALGGGAANSPIAVIGDSTFAHSGISGLFNAAYNKRNGLIIVLDNGTTAMTGMQPNPFTGQTIAEEPTVVIDYVKLGEAAGLAPGNIRIVDAYKKEEVETAIKELRATGKLSLLVAKGLCVILRRKSHGKKN